VESFTQAIMLKPEKADFFYYRGNCYNKLGETQKALLDYSMAIRIEPKKAEYYEHRFVFLCIVLAQHCGPKMGSASIHAKHKPVQLSMIMKWWRLTS
jgi:tetratricopeptide (TPR) repeat protein